MSALEDSDVMANVNISLFQGLTITNLSLFFRIIEMVFETTPIGETFAIIFREPANRFSNSFKTETFK